MKSQASLGCVGLILLLVVSGFGASKLIPNDFSNAFQGNIQSIVVYVAVLFGIFFPATVLLNLLYQPAILDDEKNKRIAELEPGIDKLEVTEFNDHAGSWGPIGIDVSNHTNSEVTGIEIELKTFQYHVETVGEKHTFTSRPDRSNCRFKTWANISGTTIKPDGHEVVNIAQIESNLFVFMLESGRLSYDNRQYYVLGPTDDVAKMTFDIAFQIRWTIGEYHSSQMYRMLIYYEGTRSYSGDGRTGEPQVHTFIDLWGLEKI